MSDLDSYITRCYDLLARNETEAQDEELCICSKLVKHETQDQPE